MILISPTFAISALIIFFYLIIQVVRTICVRYPAKIRGSSFIVAMCPRCFSVVFTWLAGLFFLPNILIGLLLGVSVYEFATIIESKQRHIKFIRWSSAIILFTLALLFYAAFEVLSEKMVAATIIGIFCIAIGLFLHEILQARKHPLAERLPTALIVMFLLIILSGTIMSGLGWF